MPQDIRDRLKYNITSNSWSILSSLPYIDTLCIARIKKLIFFTNKVLINSFNNHISLNQDRKLFCGRLIFLLHFKLMSHSNLHYWNLHPNIFRKNIKSKKSFQHSNKSNKALKIKKKFLKTWWIIWEEVSNLLNQPLWSSLVINLNTKESWT